MPRGRKYLLVAAVVVLAAGVLATVLFREREPEYGGKRLSEWILLLARPGRNEEAKRAVDAMGTNSLPFLVSWIAYQPPSWRNKFCQTINRVSYSVMHKVIFGDRKEIRAKASIAAFYHLGPEARGAVGELGRLANDPKAGISGVRAALALTVVGRPGLAPLISMFKNEELADVRKSILPWIGMRGVNAQEVVPVLLPLLTNSDLQTRREATNALQRIAPIEYRRTLLP